MDEGAAKVALISIQVTRLTSLTIHCLLFTIHVDATGVS